MEPGKRVIFEFIIDVRTKPCGNGVGKPPERGVEKLYRNGVGKPHESGVEKPCENGARNRMETAIKNSYGNGADWNRHVNQ